MGKASLGADSVVDSRDDFLYLKGEGIPKHMTEDFLVIVDVNSALNPACCDKIMKIWKVRKSHEEFHIDFWRKFED